MRKLLPFILGIVTLIWIIGGTLWYKRNYCDIADIQSSAPTVAIRQGAQTITHTAPFFFPLADVRPVFTSESIPVFKKTVDFLNSNPDKTLIIRGLYSSKEKSLKPNTDLGIYRALSIKEVLSSMGAADEAIEIESSKNDNLHFINNQLSDGIEFLFSNNTNVVFQSLNIYFPNRKFQFKESDELSDYFRILGKFLIINPETTVTISAHASITEGGLSSTRRLEYIKSFLEIKRFDLNRFKFQNKKTQSPLTRGKNIKNQRIEIRIA
jgi:outer membrane protein OmpA-like peptidoglycan-associated protein